MLFNNQNLEDGNSNEKTKIDDFKKELISFFKDLVVIIIIVFIVRTFFVLPFQISGQSMYDSYYDKEFIIVNRFGYLNVPFFGPLKEPKRGDVIVFNTHIDGKEYFIKRVIGLPGDTLKIQSGSVFVKEQNASDFVELDEKYLMDTNYKATFVRGTEDEYIYQVPENNYFVMGDNRNASTDSRSCFSVCEPGSSNFIKRKDIVGKLFIDLGYFNLKSFSFVQSNLGIDTKPRWLSSPSNYEYK